jgi:hypothetical protein
MYRVRLHAKQQFIMISAAGGCGWLILQHVRGVVMCGVWCVVCGVWWSHPVVVVVGVGVGVGVVAGVVSILPTLFCCPFSFSSFVDGKIIQCYSNSHVPDTMRFGQKAP